MTGQMHQIAGNNGAKNTLLIGDVSPYPLPTTDLDFYAPYSKIMDR